MVSHFLSYRSRLFNRRRVGIKSLPAVLFVMFGFNVERGNFNPMPRVFQIDLHKVHGAEAPYIRLHYALVVNVAQVVLPSVLMYRRVVVVVAVVLMYSEPLAAETVPLGAPVPKNTPRLAVLENLTPTGVAAAAAGAVPVKNDAAPEALTVVALTAAGVVPPMTLLSIVPPVIA